MDFQGAYYTPFDLHEHGTYHGFQDLGYATQDTGYPYVRFLEDDYQPSSGPWVMTSLPDSNPFQLKHATSDLYRIDSALSLRGSSIDNCSRSTYSAMSDGYASPPTASDIAGMPPAIFPDYCVQDSWLRPCHNRTTSMSHVQNFVDTPQEQGFSDHEYAYGIYQAHDGYVTLSSDLSDTTRDDFAGHFPDVTTDECPVLRQRRPAARASTMRQATSSSRLTKHDTPRRSATLSTVSTVNDSDDEDGSIPHRPFYCPLAPYGCDSTFGSKNEWKRHFSTQHLRLEYWRCDECSTSKGKTPNDFNRRDLFTQHVRRMHAHQGNVPSRRGRTRPRKNDSVEQEVARAAQRCYRRLRSPPTSSICVICSQDFSGSGSWDERMEHLGRHFEAVKKEIVGTTWPLDVDSWVKDTDVEDWMINHGILTKTGDIVTVADDMKD